LDQFEGFDHLGRFIGNSAHHHCHAGAAIAQKMINKKRINDNHSLQIARPSLFTQYSTKQVISKNMLRLIFYGSGVVEGIFNAEFPVLIVGSLFWQSL
jgi:hypothetical protein